MSATPHDPRQSPPASPAPMMVRYSLPELLAEIKQERVTGGFGMEKLQQDEIGKLFQAHPKRRRAQTS